MLLYPLILGGLSMKNLIVPAKRENLDTIQGFIRDELSAYDCPPKALIELEIAVEEIFVNIASYAYDTNDGDAEIKCEIETNPLSVTIQFLDDGKPFDPLAKPDADLSKEGLMSRVGGLGIYMVKQSMDMVAYRYEANKNILTIKKNLE